MSGATPLLLLTSKAVASSYTPEHAVLIRRLQRQQPAAAEHKFWQMARSRAVSWSRIWPRVVSPHICDLGEDLMTVAFTADEKTRCRMAATCRHLRSLLLPLLREAEERSLRRLYLTGALD